MIRSGSDVEVTSEFSNPLAHTLQTYSRSVDYPCRSEHLRRHATAVISNFQSQLAPAIFNTHHGGLTAGMSVNVRQGFLDDPKDRGLVILRETPQPRGYVQLDCNLLGFAKPST